MGQEIHRIHFEAEDFARFERRLAAETALLGQWLQDGRFSQEGFVGGFELEAWLVNRQLSPAPINEQYLARLANPLVVPELSRFNVELNGTPQPLKGNALSLIEQELSTTWRHCLHVANELESSLVLIGILPTVLESDLSLAHISPLNRYRALNAQILAAPLVAVSANSPFLFAKQLWDETRVPLFEQAVDTGEERRVTFGAGYLEQSPLEAFADNLQRFPVLLPVAFTPEDQWLCHLRLHNGTIWRWNRMLVGQDVAGVPHLRIEHRVMPAGPSLLDMVANAALYLGAVCCLAEQESPPEAAMPFAVASANFYHAAREGLAAEVVWLGGKPVAVRELLLDELLPTAQRGLRWLGVDEEEIQRYLTVIRDRVDSGQNGAAWQKAFIAAHGRDFFRLTEAYMQHQRGGRPVHEWDV